MPRGSDTRTPDEPAMLVVFELLEATGGTRLRGDSAHIDGRRKDERAASTWSTSAVA